MLVVARRFYVGSVLEIAVVCAECQELVGLVAYADASDVFVVRAVDAHVLAVNIREACGHRNKFVEQVVCANFAAAVNRALTFRTVCEVAATRSEQTDFFSEFVEIVAERANVVSELS